MAAAEAHAKQAHDAAAAATAAAAKHEADLRDLSTAYNALEGHCFQLEGQLRTAQQQLQQANSAAAVATAAAAAAGAAGEAGLGAGGVPEAEVARRLEEVTARAKEEAEKEAEEQMTDLLVCLGQVCNYWSSLLLKQLSVQCAYNRYTSSSRAGGRSK